MKLKITASQSQCSALRSPAHSRAIALVITLLMLSVITFLLIAFLSMTRRDRNAVTASLDQDTAHMMSDAAAARAQTDIMARMMANRDLLDYDYMVSHNFINPLGFNKANVGYYTNVNYDYYGSAPFNWSTISGGAKLWAENISDLYYDPRPPVFIVTNANFPQNSDFRFWVDLNRNGRFETNGFFPAIDDNGNSTGVESYYNGEPEWIGVLKYPEYPHSPTNQFIGRYAYMVLPIGKTLDWNYIHNYSKNVAGSAPTLMTYPADGYIRDQGVGSWELNLAALLYDNSSTMYPELAGSYYYDPSTTGANSGNSFYDAAQFLAFRYRNNAQGLRTTSQLFGNTEAVAFQEDCIDEFGIGATTNSPFDFTQATDPDRNLAVYTWPGSFTTNAFYDVGDLFNPAKTGLPFYQRLTNAMANIDSYDSYTLQRLLACIGTGSNPEYGTYVYTNGTNATLGATPTWYRTKVNINYDNSQQIQAGPYSPMPTTLTPWAPLNFFTNAADLMLRSQSYLITNFAGTPLYYTNFGISGIPIYCSTNTSFCYSAKIHRMLQVAANIYEASVGSVSSNYNNTVNPTVYYPHVYRPLFSASRAAGVLTVNIIGYTNATFADAVALTNAPAYPLIDLSASNSIPSGVLPPTFNFWGVPWIVGAVKGLPSFNRYTYNNRILVDRKVLFVRSGTPALPATNMPPAFTNQFYVMNISNVLGMDAWNSYSSPFPLRVGIYASNYVTVELTNNFNYGYVTNFSFVTNVNIQNWPAFNPQSSTSGMLSIYQTNFISVPLGYYSDADRIYRSLGPTNTWSGGFYPDDLSQRTYPVHTWTYSLTNHVLYYIYDPSGNGHLLDFVNLGPFGSTNTFVPPVETGTPPIGGAGGGGSTASYWLTNGASDTGGFSAGLNNQIQTAMQADPVLVASLQGSQSGQAIYPQYIFGTGFDVSNVVEQTETWEINDPLVHYTIDDLTWPGYTDSPKQLPAAVLTTAIPTAVGTKNARYDPWPGNNFGGNQLFRDPGAVNSSAWQFPTNSFPGIGWLGRVHRGTPWQTIYLKPDNPAGDAHASTINQWGNSSGSWVNSMDTYPTNDWALVDLFTAVPNDNAARGLLSVNQTNDAAWAAVFSGVIALNNLSNGVSINPTNDIYNLMDTPTNGINAVRSNPAYNANGLFHKLGDILQSPLLTTSSPFLTNFTGTPTDEMVERIPQQTLGLLKVGQPQFVIYAWGQSLKPKNLYSSSVSFDPALNNICTNYEITGEFLSRIVCHVVGDPTAASPKIVVDSYNIEPGD